MSTETGQAIAYLYSREDKAEWQAKTPTADEARRIARNIRLPELLRQAERD
jgi:hypothetical protein